MELLLKVTLLAVLTVLVAKPIEKGASELSFVLVLGALLLGGGQLLASAKEATDFARDLTALTALSPELFTPLVKAIAIGLTVRFGGAFCRDASHEAMAALIETVGALCALIAALPLLRAVVGLLEGFL